DQADQVLQPVRHGRVDRDAGRLRVVAHDTPRHRPVVRREDRLRDRHQLGEDLDFLLDARPAAEEHVDDFLEIEHPERQLQVLRRTWARSSKQWPYSLCGSIRNTRRSGRASRIWRSSNATPLDLPTPVVPNTAKCLRTMSSTLMKAWIAVSCCKVPMSIVP